MKKICLLIAFMVSTYANDFYYEYGEKVYVTKVPKQRNLINNSIDYYSTSKGQKVGVTNELIVKCKVNIDCKELLGKYNLTSITNVAGAIFSVKIKPGDNVFNISEELYLDKNIKFAHPNFIKKIIRR